MQDVREWLARKSAEYSRFEMACVNVAKRRLLVGSVLVAVYLELTVVRLNLG